MKEYQFVSNFPDRLDRLIGESTPLTRSQGAQLIKEGYCTVQGKKMLKPSVKIEEGKEIRILVPKEEENNPKAEKTEFEILYEDRDLLVINKPAGLLVHQGAGLQQPTLVNGLLYYTSDLSTIGGRERPGIVHRLDKETSGIMVVAKNNESHQNLSEQFKNRTINKIYIAVVHGHLAFEGKIEKPIGRSNKDRKKMAINPLGREALTYWEKIKEIPPFTSIKVQIITGRTHQIRVHMADHGNPIVGDSIYGKKNRKGSRLMLHGWEMAFIHPTTQEKMKFSAPLPEEFFHWV